MGSFSLQKIIVDYNNIETGYSDVQAVPIKYDP